MPLDRLSNKDRKGGIVGLSETIEIKFEINKKMIKAARNFFKDILKVLDKYEKEINGICEENKEK